MGVGVWVDPRAGRLERQVWGWCWIVVMVLVLVLLIMGISDWLALRRYAARQARALAAERKAVLSQETRAAERADAIRRAETEPRDRLGGQWRGLRGR